MRKGDFKEFYINNHMNYPYIKLLRPSHWLKNLFIFAPSFFAGRLFVDINLGLILSTFIGFSLAASSIYIFNDICDYERDIIHPQKRYRPIAAGAIERRRARVIALILTIISIVISYQAGMMFLYLLILYMLIQVSYSLFIKDIAIGDIFSIAAGFVLRVLAGGAAFQITPSRWLMVTMFMISIVLATGKRIAEVNLLNGAAPLHRKSSGRYSKELLSEFLMISSGASLMSYSIYTINQIRGLVYTIPVVMFGLFRYLMIVKEGLGDPTEALIKDRVLSVTVCIWIALIGLILYIEKHGGIIALINRS